MLEANQLAVMPREGNCFGHRRQKYGASVLAV
jgi:hypothetical protein